MKQLSIAFSCSNADLPINYHHEVQSLIYTLLRDIESADVQFHGAGAGLRQYKLFTFSSLRGRSKVENKRITFDEMIYLDVRSVNNYFCDSLMAMLKENTMHNLCGNTLAVCFAKSEERVINTNKVNIKMLSPVEVHTTDETNHSYYYTPLDKDFSEQIDANFNRKWMAYTGNPPVGSIEIALVNVSARDKYVTLYKGTHITGWRGEYMLSGNPEYLNFLYYCGIGARNSSGFGMFDVVSPST
jgi:CRISPR-associated endoribonuclease Cas6